MIVLPSRRSHPARSNIKTHSDTQVKSQACNFLVDFFFDFFFVICDDAARQESGDRTWDV